MRFYLPQMTKICGALVVALTMAGCGGSSSTSTSHQAVAEGADTTASTASTVSGQPTATTATTEVPLEKRTEAEAGEPHVAMTLSSSVRLKQISSHYTCEGANVSLPFTWTTPPPGTVELVLVIANAEDVNGGKLFSDWGVAGLKPSLRSLSSSHLPVGAIIGRNSFGKTSYSLCPAKNSANEHYAVLLFARTHGGTLKSGFSASALAEKLLHTRVGEGLLGFTYKPR
jgi:phosphatidylethanolamine-binding protein (PEBP) family uncharacterized protein